MFDRPLGKITALLADLNMEVSYAYDDLVFVQFCTFLLQFTDDQDKLKLFINKECDPKEAELIAANIMDKFAGDGFDVQFAGRYALKSNENETVNIEFCEE